MRKATPITSILLVSLLLINMFSMTLIKTYYEWDKEFIAKNRCINTEVTDANCYGKCFLEKNLNLAKETGVNTEKVPQSFAISMEYLALLSEINIDTTVEEVEIRFPRSREKLQEGVYFLEHLPPSC